MIPVLTRFLCRPTSVGVLLFFLSLVYYLAAALEFPALFNLDNHVNYAATSYLAEHHKIPVVTAHDPEIMFSELGTTRLLRPPFTFIVSAVANNFGEAVVDDRIARQRLGSPLIAALAVLAMFVGFWIAFQQIGLALLGALAIGLLPKFVFLASCNNDDIGAILSVSLLFTSTLALLRYGHRNWVLIVLAVSIGLVLQTKFTAWLTLPWFGLFIAILLKPAWPRVVKMLPLLLLLVIIAGGWWVLFNMYHYGLDDPAAMRHATQIQASLSDLQPNRQGYSSLGYTLPDLLSNHDQFVSKSYKSLIGYLQWLNLEVGNGAYVFYGGIFLIGIVGVLFRAPAALRETNYLEPLILLLLVSQVCFYLHHNLVRDIQPQARYILPLVMPMMYLFLRVLEQVPGAAVGLRLRGREYGFQAIAVSVLLATVIALHVFTLYQYIRPSYTPKPFYLSIQPPAGHSLQDSFKVVSASSLYYGFANGKLELRRLDNDIPTLLLAPEICARLPLNALLTLRLSSPYSGGIYLRLDHNNNGTYDDLYWRRFPAGQSLAAFSLRTENCTGMQITLSAQTQQLTLEELQISEIKIHEHGKPI